MTKSCSMKACSKPSFKCYIKGNNSCGCGQKRLFYPRCSRILAALGVCNGVAGAYVPAITVCNQRIF
jgi:hypothetical protein